MGCSPLLRFYPRVLTRFPFGGGDGCSGCYTCVCVETCVLASEDESDPLRDDACISEESIPGIGESPRKPKRSLFPSVYGTDNVVTRKAEEI